MKLFNGLVVYSDGNLCVGIKGKLNVVAAVAFPNFLSRQLHVFTTSADKNNFTECLLLKDLSKNGRNEHMSMGTPLFLPLYLTPTICFVVKVTI